jgi:hypothetical protein
LPSKWNNTNQGKTGWSKAPTKAPTKYADQPDKTSCVVKKD